MNSTLTSDFYDIVTFPSCRVRDMACKGVLSGLRQHVREFEIMGWLESRFALAVCAQHYGESDGEMPIIEAELKAIYVSAGVVDAMRRITGEEISADDLLSQITAQVQSTFTDS